MRSYTCSSCGQLVFFENSECLRCHAQLGFRSDVLEVVALRPDLAHSDLLAPVGDGSGRRYRRCANAAVATCNWLVETAGAGTDEHAPLCRCCELTRVRPNDGDAAALAGFAAAEAAKRRLVFQLLDLGLPVARRDERTGTGLAFDLLAAYDDAVTIGHAGGQITLDVAEADDARRERVRQELGEPYRTVLGHLRHEIGHYYFPVLVGRRRACQQRARKLFGDETADYAAEVERHYRNGPPEDWSERHVSAYATMHPAEDWAETFAHYLHIRDTLQTAAAFGILVTGPATEVLPGEEEDLVAVPALDVESDPLAAILDDWLPLTYALNAVNRSMGKPDLYPFIIPPPVIEKLAFVHDVVREVRADPY